MAEILIVDDDRAFREGLRETLTDLGHVSHLLDSGHAVLQELNDVRGLDRYAAVFLDLKMPGLDGLEVLRTIRADNESPTVPIIILTAYADSANTMEAMKLGAFDHLTKPLGRAAIDAVLTRALSRPHLKQATESSVPSSEKLLGSCPAMRQVQKTIGVTAPTEATVLILGETGTGKEEVARALHQYSVRALGPFVAVNCAAIPGELLESELFGHVKGAFTGATAPRQGKFQEAHTGTLFLDEIGDMPLTMQVKILRALETRTLTPVGATAAQKVNIRIIAATHRDLMASVRDGTFREDLYYRLNILRVHLPPLRERGSDILVLAEHFLQQSKPGQAKVLDPDAAAALLAYHWPGNVRELRNLMQKLSIMVPGSVIKKIDLELGSAAGQDNHESRHLLTLDFHTAIATLEKALLQRALDLHAGNRSRAAASLKMRRQLFYAKLQEHHLE